MAQDLPPFLKEKGRSIEYTGSSTLILIVPEKYFDCGMAEIVGQNILLFGVVNYTFQTKDGKLGALQLLDIPTRFLTKPSEVEKLKSAKLLSTSEELDYRLLKYTNGDIFAVESEVPEEIENVESFMSLFVINGHIPNTIPYDKLQSLFIENMAANGNSYGVNLQIFGIMISELCRSKSDINVPFRLSGNADMHAYKSLSVKNIPKYISAYSSLGSDDFIYSLIAATMNKNQVGSPLEKVMMGGK